MIIKSSRYITSSPDIMKCPKSNLPEFAFTGRSNVGKSSLINLLTNKTKLAKTSSTPGKTRQINHFFINEEWYIVDLPGYGYAKVSKDMRKDFDKNIKNYLLFRQNLACLFILIDCRHLPLKNDLDFIRWVGMNGVPFSIIFTKADKLNESSLEKNLDQYRNVLSEEWESLPQIFVTSSTKQTGKEQILEFIDKVIKSYNDN